MTELTNQQLLDALPKIFSKQEFTPTEELHISTWHVLPWQKMLIPGTQLINGKKVPVRLKVRVPGNINPKTTFVANETVARLINESVFAAGLPAQRTLVFDFETPPEWIIREDIDGVAVGNHLFDSTVSSDEILTFLRQLRPKLDEIGPKIDRRLITRYSWQTKWLEQFSHTESDIATHLGEELYTTVKNELSRTVATAHTNSLIHTDLTPINILRGSKGLFAIDWNEALWGPRAIDWMTVCSSAYGRPELQEGIVKEMIGECDSPDEREETVRVARVTAYWMLYKFAGSYDYFLKHPGDSKTNTEEAVRAFPLVKDNFSWLLNLLQ